MIRACRSMPSSANASEVKSSPASSAAKRLRESHLKTWDLALTERFKSSGHIQTGCMARELRGGADCDGLEASLDEF